MDERSGSVLEYLQPRDRRRALDVTCEVAPFIINDARSDGLDPMRLDVQVDPSRTCDMDSSSQMLAHHTSQLGVR